MPSYKKQMVFLILSFLVCLIFIVSLLREMQSQAVDVLNSRQRVYAKLTAKNISDFFTHQMAVLNHLAQTDEIIRLDAKGKAILQSFQATGNKYITGVSRVDARGKLLFTWPDVQGVSGRDISNQPHVQRILQTKQVTISDPFTAVQGYEGIALHAPVWRGQRFDGTVAFLISFADLAREHLGSLFIPNQRYTLLITADGKILQCNNPVHKGTSATDLYRSNLEALAMIDAMTAGKEGSASFVERQAGDDFNGRRVYAVYIPIQVGDRHWALAVVSSDDMLMPSSMGLKNRILILSAILLLIFAAIAYMAARIRTAAQEAQKRRQIEESLLVSAREIHDLYHNAPCGYHSLDSQGRIVRVNDTELTWLGYTRKELEGKSYVDLLSPESQKRFTEAFDRVKLCNLARDIEYDMIRKDESTFPVLVTASAVLDPDGRFLMTRSMVMDITERRRQEEQLRESETLYRTAMETTSDGITITQNRKYVYANKKLMETIGRPDEELTGKTAGVYIHADDRKFLEENFAAVSRGLPMPNPTYDIRVVKPDGSVVYVSVINVPITYHGKPATLAFIKDVTLQKQYEAALQESEKLYRTALEATSDGVTIVQNGIYAYVNQKFLDTMGVEREVIIDQPLGILAGPEAQDGLRAFLKRHPQADSAADINLTRVQKTDGSFIYFQSSSVDIIYRGKPAILTFIKDITESKKAEQALRESETLYRTALETTSDGILISDVAEAKYLYINQKLLDTLGRPHENLIGAPIDLYIHPDDVGLGKKYFLERKREGKKASYYESRLIKPDGDISLISITSTDIIFQGRKAVISFVQDITEKKRQEQALRESEELYRTALEKSNDGISIIQDGKYVYANPKLLKTIGREEEGIVGLPLGFYTHPDDREKVRAYYEARQKGEPVPQSYDMRVVKPDGSVIIINITAIKISYQGRPATMSFILDITERKKAEEALRRSEERYRTIIESIDDDYFETDLKGRITFFNKPTGWSGHKRTELVGRQHTEYTSPQMAKKVETIFNKIYRDGKPARITDYEVIRPDGHLVYLEMSVSLMRDADGKPIGFRGISRDVTEQKKMEEERSKLTEQLHQAQKMEAIGTLAGGIAHDFNNLLMGIQGYTSLMLLDMTEAHPFTDQLKAVQTLVQSGATLTKQLLGFARAGRYEVAPTDLNALIAKAIALFARTRKEIRIFEKYDPHLRPADVDRGQIDQVLLNIFVNAWQAMPAGGSLYVETQNKTLDDTSANHLNLPAGTYVQISITDNGIGMDDKTLQRIFDPFFTTKEMGRGTGLGLASAYGIIKGHGGTISVSSATGEGSTFDIYLPASSSTPESEQTDSSETIRGHETVLLVDDEEIITDVSGRLLEELGYRVLVAHSGDEALVVYNNRCSEIDLVIVDMIMPGMSGSETFDRLKAINPDVRVILSSGYSVDGKAQAILDRGVRVFLQKPYRLDDLAQKIREALADT